MIPILRPCHAHVRAIPAFRRYLFRSAGTLSSPELNDTLHQHISGDRRASFIPVLEQWKQKGNQVNHSDLRIIIETLRDSQRFPQALKVSEWMSEQQKVCDLIPEDFTARLHLIENVLGLEEAYNFYQGNIPENKRDYSVYNTIMSFYAKSPNEKYLSKAESIFEKMRELRYLTKPSPYNNMMSLYNQLGKQDMAHKILTEMEKNNVEPDSLTFNVKLRVYAAENNVETVEKLLLADNNTTTLDWRTCCDIAKAYLKHDLVEKAQEMMSKAEKSIDTKSKKLAYESLMVLYGDARKVEDVKRIWNMYKNLRERDNEGIRSVLTSLLKLDDINGADMITKEYYDGAFGDGYKEFDVRIVSMMVSAYCERGLLKKAEVLLNNVMLIKYIIDMPRREILFIIFLLVNTFITLDLLLLKIIDAMLTK